MTKVENVYVVAANREVGRCATVASLLTASSVNHVGGVLAGNGSSDVSVVIANPAGEPIQSGFSIIIAC